ncbi:MAG: phytanoyl-CoA dioxygenase family protein [Candidatus Latescibacterota bacterium]|nr:phytanoyl-CoA dioxygenase family protein [Candidatus Latescibacterota bacterium]
MKTFSSVPTPGSAVCSATTSRATTTRQDLQRRLTTSPEQRQLERDGFCVFDDVLDDDLLQRTRQVSERLLDALPAEHLEKQKSTGSMVSVTDDPFFAELVAAPDALRALQILGYDNPKWASGFIISKPPHSPALFWHQDWWGWDEPISQTWAHPPQAFLMYYLVDTTPENGCLRLVPGSHRKRHPMHDGVPDSHTTDLREMADPEHPAYHTTEGEIDAPVKAGSVVIGDSRMLHASHANMSDHRRTVITLWYYPNWDELPESVRAHIGATTLPASWEGEAMATLGRLQPTYDGDVERTKWNRIPGPEFR